MFKALFDCCESVTTHGSMTKAICHMSYAAHEMKRAPPASSTLISIETPAHGPPLYRRLAMAAANGLSRSR